jgi:hypothetical protein
VVCAKSNTARPELDIDDNDPNDYRNIEVEPLGALNVQLYASAGASSYHFEALGYKPGTTTLVTRKAGQPFSVYNHDFYSDELFFAELLTGVDHDAGVVWPRLKGTRNGHSYWYMCRVPQVIRDVVNYCDPGPDCYYRLPWAAGDTYKVWQGNNGSLSHKGSQKYAFDFGMPAGEVIYAARGGTVTFVEESQTENCNTFAGEDWCPANELLIEHQDGTVSQYAHMPEEGVIVDEGDVVKRGYAVAVVGDTGNATEPHLHFDVLESSQSQTILIRLEAKVGGKLKKCLVPNKGDKVTSTNV